MDNASKYQVCVVTGTRAEYGLLRRTLFEFKKHKEIDLKLVVTGAHLSNAFGNTQEEIIKDGFVDYVSIPIPLENDSKEGMAISSGVAITRFAEYFEKNKQDILVVLGDRYEIFSAAFAAHIMGIPIAHISGGDITEGAVDDAIRHCLTKLSSIHFPGCEQSAKRIVQMGEKPDRVFNVGEPGVENCMKMELLSRRELYESVGFDGLMGNYSVVTFHPVTREEDAAVSQVYELISAMDSYSDMSYIITMANSDAGGKTINDIWLDECGKRSNWYVVSSLGVLRYLSALKYSQLVIGNSSSGIVEAPVLGVPTINIGSRQKGRMLADSVICCEPIAGDIVNAMHTAMTDEFRELSKHTINPFGDGTTSSKIVNILLDFLKDMDNKKINDKHFFDIDFKCKGKKYE